MNTHTRSRFLAWLLLVAMVLTMLPTAAFAAEAATYTKITTMEELTSGQYVMVVNTGYGPGVYENGWITAQAIDAGSDTVTGSVLPWTITVDGDTVKLTDSNGVAAAPKGGNNNGIVAGEYDVRFQRADRQRGACKRHGVALCAQSVPYGRGRFAFLDRIALRSPRESQPKGPRFAFLRIALQHPT